MFSRRPFHIWHEHSCSANLLRQATSSLAILLGQSVTWSFPSSILASSTFELHIGTYTHPAWVDTYPLRFLAAPLKTKAVLITPYLTRQQAEQLRRLKQQYLDGAGNAYLQSNGHLVLIQGRPRPTPLQAPKPSGLLPPTSLRLLYYLLSEPALLHLSYRRISKQVGIALGSVHTFFAAAYQQCLLEERPSGQRQWLHPDAALSSWLHGYEQVLRPNLYPERHRWQMTPGLGWRQLPLASGAYWGGEPAALMLLGERHASPSTFTLHSPVVPSSWGLLPDPVAGQLEIVMPPFKLPVTIGSLAPLLTYTELQLVEEQRGFAQCILERYLPHLRKSQARR